ncbi:MAG TPA: Fic family protein, partial [Campylobacterales bacterium]|nr:Fic family protein [Campylobacterales bacterium]
ATVAAKEVHHYAKGLLYGFEEVKKTELLTQKTILTVQEHIEQNRAGYRKLPGTALKNDMTGETVYTPPQSHDEIIKLMDNLEKFMNDSTMSDCDPLVKMAVIHHQFESIHPFYDGNGRSGRIINILYLVKEKLLNLPVLYLSRYINANRAEYYRLLQHTRDSGEWEKWTLFMLDGVESTARQTTTLIHSIKALMQSQKDIIRTRLPRIYSQDLLNNIFRHPYTKIEFLVQELGVHRNTAAKYLDELASIGILIKHKISKENYYLNKELFDLFLSVGENNGVSK